MKLRDPNRPRIGEAPMYVDKSGKGIAPIPSLTLYYRKDEIIVSAMLKLSDKGFGYKSMRLPYEEFEQFYNNWMEDLEGSVERYFGLDLNSSEATIDDI